MKAVAYLCSYKADTMEYLEDIQRQKDAIEDFCIEKHFDIIEYCAEDRESSEKAKPALLSIISDFYGTVKRIIVYDLQTLSPNEEFRNWVMSKIAEAGFELFFVKQVDETAENQKALRLKDKIKNIPSLPEVVIKIMQLVKDDNSSAAELAGVISKDSALSAKVLKLVNSSFYGFSKQITTIKQAITILGYTTIKGYVMSSGVYRIFAPRLGTKSEFDYETFWKHNLLCAFGAQYLAGKLNFDSSEDIFSAAILHDLGKLILAQYDSENYTKVLKNITKEEDYEDILKLEEEFCKTTHSEVAYVTASCWNLPELICDVILYHHCPQKCQKNKFSCIIVNITNKLSDLIICGKSLDFKVFDWDTIGGLVTEKEISEVYKKMAKEAENLKDITRFFGE